MFTKLVAVGLLATTAILASPASATAIPDGTVTVAGLYTPVVNFDSAPATYSATLGTTFEVVGTGGFAGATGLLGRLDGTLLFSSSIGTSIAQLLPDFFVFNDGAGGTFNFSVDSVRTQGYSNRPDVSSSASLYLLGTTIDTFNNMSATPTSLTLSFNSTGGSAFSTSATLAVPPENIGSVPEPTSWALMLVGFGAMGATMRRRRTAVSFA